MQDECRDGDFAQVMLAHLDAAYNLARWLVRDTALAEDVVQDAYERAFKYCAAYRGPSSKAWLLGIVRHVAYSTLDAERRRTAWVTGDEAGAVAETTEPSPGPEAALAQRQELTALDSLLGTLPVQWRECLILREIECASYAEMAQIMCVPLGTVMSRLWRARQALRRAVAT